MLSNLAARDVETVIHPYTNLATLRETGPLVIERGKGIWVYDSDGQGLHRQHGRALVHGARLRQRRADRGRERADAQALLRPPVRAARATTRRSSSPRRSRRSRRCRCRKVFFCAFGSEANDTQVKLVRYMNNALGRPKKKKIIARPRPITASPSLGASLTGLPHNHRDFDLPLAGILHTTCPHHFAGRRRARARRTSPARLAAELEELIEREGPETIAAFIAEPVMGAGGVIVPPKSYFEKVSEGLPQARHLMISDEVICGFGRLGTRSAADARLQAALACRWPRS